MKGELKVPGPLMQEYSQFDGMAVEVQTGTGGFAPSTLRLPIARMRTVAEWYALSPEVYINENPDMGEAVFRLTHLRFSDDTLVYELRTD